MLLHHCSSLYRNTEQSFLCYYTTVRHYTETQNNLFFVTTPLFVTIQKHRTIFSLLLHHCSSLYRNTEQSFLCYYTTGSSLYRNTEQSFLCYYTTVRHYIETQNNLFFVTTPLFVTLQKHRTIFSLLLHHCSSLYRNTEQSFLCYYTTVRHFIETQNNLFFVTTPLFVTIQKHRTIFSLLLHHCSSLYRNTEQSFLCYYTTVRHYTETQNNLFFVTKPLVLHYTETQNNLFFVTTPLFLTIQKHRTIFSLLLQHWFFTIQKHRTIFSLLLYHCSSLYRNTEQSFLCYYTTVRYFTETQNNLFFVTTPLFVTI